MDNVITMAHGSGGGAMGGLIDAVFSDAFGYDRKAPMEDAAVVEAGRRIAMTTDSFVVTPLVFRGGDIGRLSVCGTVNDLLTRGSVPAYLTAGFILEEGLDVGLLRKIVSSMAETAREAGVRIVTGDTKVIEGRGGLMINTAGVGLYPEKDPAPEGTLFSAGAAKSGDAVIVTGRMGDHHAAILSERLSIETDISSDCAPLTGIVRALREEAVPVHTLRDVTRGGLATVLKELAGASQLGIEITGSAVPVSEKVRDFAGLLGLDPLYMGNEGKMVMMVPAEDSERTLEIIRKAPYGSEAAVIGCVTEEHSGEVHLKTDIGGIRRLDVLQGEGLPRIC